MWLLSFYVCVFVFTCHRSHPFSYIFVQTFETWCTNSQTLTCVASSNFKTYIAVCKITMTMPRSLIHRFHLTFAGFTTPPTSHSKQFLWCYLIIKTRLKDVFISRKWFFHTYICGYQNDQIFRKVPKITYFELVLVEGNQHTIQNLIQDPMHRYESWCGWWWVHSPHIWPSSV